MSDTMKIIGQLTEQELKSVQMSQQIVKWKSEELDLLKLGFKNLITTICDSHDFPKQVRIDYIKGLVYDVPVVNPEVANGG